jgi:hypothetical protein
VARIIIDTGEIAASPVYDIGKWTYICDNDKVLEVTQAFIMLGFTPEVFLDEQNVLE